LQIVDNLCSVAACTHARPSPSTRRAARPARERAARARVEASDGSDYAREQGSPGWAPFEEAIGALEGGTAVAFASGMARRRRSSTRSRGARSVVGPRRGYAWTRSLLASGATSTGERRHADTDATLRAARAPTCCGSSRRATRCVAWRTRRLCAAAAGRGRLDASRRRCCSGRWSSARASRCTVATKFIGGHTDLLLGVVTRARPRGRGAAPARARAVRRDARALEAFLALRGLRTLPVRLELAQATAATLAARLRQHPAVSAVHYADPVAFMDGTGAMLAFETAVDVCSRVELFTHAKSLGGVESLIEERAPGLIRVSVGCEHAEDLWNDLEQALA
jgi:cystathionine gamma-synthase